MYSLCKTLLLEHSLRVFPQSVPSGAPSECSLRAFPQVFPQSVPSERSLRAFPQSVPSERSLRAFPQSVPQSVPSERSLRAFPQSVSSGRSLRRSLQGSRPSDKTHSGTAILVDLILLDLGVKTKQRSVIEPKCRSL